MNERMGIIEHAQPGAGIRHQDSVKWHCRTVAELRDYRDGSLLRRVEDYGNLLLLGGGSVLWEYALGNGTTSTASAKHYLNSKCGLGIGNSTVAAANTQKALQGASKVFKVMSAGFPTHTTGSTVAGVNTYTLKSTFTTLQGNFAWGEWGVVTIGTTAAVQRLINRKSGAPLLTKTSAATASLTVTLTLA